MKILMIANYVSFPWEAGNCRFMYLADLLYKNNEVELVTSNFCHTKKQKREYSIKYNKLKFKVSLLDEPGYRKNISIKRIYSHKILSRNVRKYLNNLVNKPDVIYCSIPSLDLTYEAVKYANKNNIRFVIDIQDLWPEAFKMAINIPIISDLIFYPMMKKANYIYSHSDEIVAVSQTYVNRALKVNRIVNDGLSVFLGTDLDYFDECCKKNKKSFNDGLIRIVYIGTLGTSYDIKSVIDSIKILTNKGINNIEFVVIGDGPLKVDFEKYAKEARINCIFTGRLDYPKMVGLLCSCDIAINPIVGSSVASIINKVGDYAASGLRVLNTQNSQEYRDLIDNYSAGFNCENGNASDIADKMEKLITNRKLRINMGKGNRLLAEEKFNRKENYKSIIRLIGGDTI